jgi:hypothetical protein
LLCSSFCRCWLWCRLVEQARPPPPVCVPVLGERSASSFESYYVP